MKILSANTTTCLLLTILPASVHAANLFIDPAIDTGYNMYSGAAPYPTASTDVWNSGYSVSAYTGSNTDAHPGAGASTAHQNVWAFASASITTLETGTFGAADDFLKNDNNTTWTQGDNYAKITVTLSASNPDLILVTEGDAVLNEDRGWMTAVQIVSVPEPSSLHLLLGGMMPLLAARRR